ncbi:hypothetical protein ILUMI_20405 [Ignelater luminosus]|uniref:SAFB-like transcription modulator n=1 Tax=Ignelater luminosus TaxID=2038154 RepID=A0A8K0CE82_IGNLU|nr:hypothetical protein ILUMI_20405 [Ignelater luminosus]
MSAEPENRKLSDLRVVDLKSELEKRGLDKSGNKQALLDRLQKALQDEGLDPETYQFDGDKKPAKRLSTSSNQLENDAANQKDQNSEAADDENEDGDNAEANDSSEQSGNISKTDDLEKMDTSINSDGKPNDKERESNEGKDSEEHSKKDGAKEDSKESELKEDGPPIESESPIRLTLEEEEAFQDEEIEPVTENANKQNTDGEKADEEDKKNSTNKNQEHAAKETPVNSDKAQESKKQDGIASTGGASANKSASKSKKGNSQNRNLWITNISQTTRATELKQALSAYGKVIGAKVVINAKYPGACCYGYVTMDTVEDADNCIAKLNNTELNGQIIRIEKVRPDHMNSIKLNPKLKQDNKDDKNKQKTPHKSPHGSKSQEHGKDDEKKDGKEGDKDKDKKDDKKDDKKEGKTDGHKSDTSSGRRRDSKRKSRSRDRIRSRDRHRSDSKGSRPRHGDKDVLTFDKIKEERERQRLRERERIIREENRRRREEAARQREVERMQRSEAARLDREREKLRLEREKLEREKAEIIRLERERQKLEREKLELEKLELQRAKMRLQEEDRRAVKRSAPYRREGSYEDRKRMAGERRYEESPPPPRFDPSNVKAPTPPSKKFGSAAKDYKSRVAYDKRESYPKRDREYETERAHPQSSIARGPPTTITKYEGSSVFNLSRERDMRDARPRDNNASVPNSRMAKDARYNERERERSPHYRPVRDERDRRAMPDHKGDVRSSREHRYPDPTKGNIDAQRFDRNSGGNSWNHPGAASNKVFNAGGSGGPPKAWAKDAWRPADAPNNAERWNSGGVSRGTSSLSTTAFSGNSNMNMGPSCPPPPAINNYSGDRFEYKSMSNIRKY